MDILKLLSRSTKHTNKSHSAPGAKNTNLPSTGTATNPQLYNDPIPESRGTKRKRAEVSIEKAHTTEPISVPNFFASGEAQLIANNESKNTPVAESGTVGLLSDEPTAVLDEEECKRILRSHRLKVTNLPPPTSLDQKSKKSSKNRKSSKPVAKAEVKQLFPQPLVAFKELGPNYGISKRLGENIKAQGYKIPTEVQMGSLPLLLSPEKALSSSADAIKLPNEIDLLAVAPTGSGKTLAFLVPVVNSMVQRRREKRGEEHSLEAIIIAPTKELASQIVNEGRKLALGTGIKLVGMQKGMRVAEHGAEDTPVPEHRASDTEESSSEDDEDDEAGKGSKLDTKAARRQSQPLVKADIIVTTPLILLHALSTKTPNKYLPIPTVRHLILDEADVLLDALFKEQTLGIWEACINPGLRVTLWSATMGSNIEALAAQTIQARRERLGLLTQPPLIRLVVGLKDSAIPNISHRLVYAASESGKLIALRQLLRPTSGPSTSEEAALRPPFLVFTQTIPRAVALHSELLYDIPIEAGGSSRLAVLHSDLSDSARSAVMARFRNGDIWVLITTDILSRGVDFRGINGVVNYDVPNSGASYIHRVGRTGRAGRNGGVAVTFYTKEDIPYVKNIANIIAASERQAGKTGGLQKWLLDALPTPSKKVKKDLKMHGVEARRTGLAKDKYGKSKGAQISTKSGYERKIENRKKGAIMGSMRRANVVSEPVAAGEESDWGGIDD